MPRSKRYPWMLKLPDVSLACLDTRHPDLAVFAMQRCLAQAHFREAILLTVEGYVSPDPRIIIHPVARLCSMADYSAFIIKKLGGHVGGSHVLVMQWDSFILDPLAWDPAFLDYDYLGATWPHRTPPVGNGGFSLRSRRLLEALQDQNIRELQPEDYCICELYRELLERRHGIRFAPEELAQRFSFELATPHQATFGFHGLFNFHRALPEADLLAWLDHVPPPLLRSMQARRLVKNLIREGHTAPARKILQVRARGGLKLRLDALKLSSLLAARRLWS
ncbi:MAG: DUF5672 family protein [Zoogloea sp.]|uniref:DUF5672 family protein n=1 Tax=Zoogloea sp. TaxID=49181 RepID=UPI002633116A|nr:DUF5672 family protein [Zoogloea sp.]MDD2988185.1 DUF5672 family protein [Zoogloea sp.]